MDEMNLKLEEMIQQGTTQMGKAKLDEKIDIKLKHQTATKTKRVRTKRTLRETGIQRYQEPKMKQYAIMTLPSGLFLLSFIMVYMYPYTLMGIFAIFMCLFVGFKYFVLWLNELSDEVMKMMK